MINQIYNHTANSISKCTRSFIPKSLTMRITCVAALALGCAVSYKIAKNWYQDYQFKSAVVKWASDEGGKANKAVERILNCYENKRATLCLSGLSLKGLPDSIGGLTGLTSLNVSDNELESLPDSISGLIELTSLNVSNNKLKSLWDSIDGLTALTILNASNNELALLPDSIGRLKALRTLNVSNNELVLLPDSIGRLKALRTLNVWHNNLKSLPDSIDGLTALAWLDASSNKLETLPESIGELKDPDKLCIWKNLFRSELAKWASDEGGKANEAVERILNCYENKRATLCLSGLSLKSLPDSIGRLKALTRLDVSDNKLKSLPDSIGELKSLETLVVSNNELVLLPESIGGLKALTSLDVFDNKLKSLPESIGGLKALTNFVVFGNKLKSLPDSIGGLKALTNFVVFGNKLKSLPDSIGRLEALTNFVVFGNKLKSLPDSIGRLEALTRLDVSDNKLKSLPDSIGGLKALTSLDVSRNKLEPLPDSIGGLTGLTSLNVSNNELESLPDSIGGLTGLTSLNVSNNELESLLDWIVRLEALTSLDVFGNKLQSLPESIGGLKALTRLDVSHNKLQSLPDSIGGLTGLTSLNVFGNKLKSLPESIGRLKALLKLDVFHNKLETLPESIGELQDLENLVISYNQLSSLPETLSRLTKLKKLNLKYNLPLSSIPDSLLTLSNTCTIYLEGAGLSEHYLSRINRITSQEGYEGPTIEFSMESGRTTDTRPLSELLSELYGIAGCAQPQRLLPSASKSEKNSLLDWLSRLSDTYEYRRGGVDQKKGLAKKIIGYLKLANDDESFKNAFFSLIQGETETCGDRIALSIMRLGVLKGLVESDLSNMKGLAELLKKGVWTIGLPAGDSPVMGLLEQCANAKMQTMRFYDDVEVILAYPVKLKESLGLPLDIEDMLFYGFSYVTGSDIDAAKGYVEAMWSNQEQFHEFLIGQTKWLEALEHNYPDDYSRENALELTKKALQPC